MIDINKILEIVDSEKEVFLAREDKPMVVIMPFDKYNKLNKENKVEKGDTSNQINVNNDYINKIRKSLLDE